MVILLFHRVVALFKGVPYNRNEFNPNIYKRPDSHYCQDASYISFVFRGAVGWVNGNGDLHKWEFCYARFIRAQVDRANETILSLDSVSRPGSLNQNIPAK